MNLVIYPANSFFNPFERTMEISFRIFLFSRKSFEFFSKMAENSSYDFLNTFEAQNIMLGIKLTCAGFNAKHLENFTGPSVSTRILLISVFDNKTCLSFA